jgi:hypothetical protein
VSGRGYRATALARQVSLVALLVAVSVACGVKAPPRPPENVVPTPITDLRGTPVRDGIELRWGRPRKSVDGRSLSDLAGFHVERATGGAPAFARIATVEVTDRDRIQQQRVFRFTDPGLAVGDVGRYRVVSFTLDGYVSDPSNVVTVERTHVNEEVHAPLPGAQR